VKETREEKERKIEVNKNNNKTGKGRYLRGRRRKARGENVTHAYRIT